MDAFHVRTLGLQDDAAATRVERAVSGVDGVISALAVKALDVTSVLYEPLAVDRDTIVEAIRRAGYPARVLVFGDEGGAGSRDRGAA